jgi:EAL domain-containing protein (putative c-di-GMP-specific phosphodiesterase class I)
MQCNFAEWLDLKIQQRTGRPDPEQMSRVPKVLKTGELAVVLQPIVSLADGSTYAYEALVRSTSPDFVHPPHLFEQAIEGQVCGALGRAIRELAVEGCPATPLFLNIHPNEFDEGWLVRPDDPIFIHDHRIYLEITESVPLSHFDRCTSVLQEIRSKEVLLAVDDLGAGYSNLKYIADLAPEVVKLDRKLVANLSEDRRLRTLVGSIILLCVDLGAKVVAEGLERPEEVKAVRDAGAHFGQGYIFAKPAYPPPVFEAQSFAEITQAS